MKFYDTVAIRVFIIRNYVAYETRVIDANYEYLKENKRVFAKKIDCSIKNE